MLLKENVVMRTIDFAPLFRSTIGFDRLFDALDEGNSRPSWPPYNIEKSSDNRYRITMALAGFGPEEVDVIQQGNTLLVTGQKAAEQHQQEMLHQGLAFRNFRQSFSLADHMKVAGANLQNGLLSVDLVREVPEELKPRRIQVGAANNAANLSQDSRPKLVDQGPEQQSNAA
jgi:molecular chaperone IbpA